MSSAHEERPLLAEKLPTGETHAIHSKDEHIGSWIRRRTSALTHQESTLTTNNDNDSVRGDAPTGTTFGQSIVHLVKGYIGCGILSLPWALSQLGIPLGLLAIVVMSLWSSHNCWTIVKVKWYIEQCNAKLDAHEDLDSIGDDESKATNYNDNDDDDKDDDEGSRSSRLSFASTSKNSASSNVTYPDIGEWAYGSRFQTYVTVCICAQQLAICTVFVGFVGENVLATLRYCGISHLGKIIVTTGCLPVLMAPSCLLPTLASMAPVMAVATVLMLSGFATLGWIALSKWSDRPLWEDLPSFEANTNAAMALCGILYSFEGICIVVPIESSMKNPRTDFRSAFWISVGIITILLCGMAAVGVFAFGTVTNGSITAFLLERYPDDPELTVWVMLSNALVTVSIAVSYPLQLYPAVELVAPAFAKWVGHRKLQKAWTDGGFRDAQTTNDQNSVSECNYNDKSSDKDRLGLKGIPEHRALSVRSLLSTSESECEEPRNQVEDPSMNDAATTASNSVALPGDSPALRAGLVAGTYVLAMAVPNVHNLVSLVGAVTGSSTALLIPPILELAYLRRKEVEEALSHSRNNIKNVNSIVWNRVVAWGLLILGSIFALIGSYFSVLDILKSYST